MTADSHNLVLSVGSNVDPQFVTEAIEWLQTQLSNCKASSVYPTLPANCKCSLPYTNAVVRGVVNEGLETFDNHLKQYEVSKGRDETARKESRVTVDIDIVIWDNEVLKAWDFRQPFFQKGFSEF